MHKVQRWAAIPPSLRRLYWFFNGCGYVAIVACIAFVALVVATFMGYRAEDAMLSAATIAGGCGGIWMLGMAARC